MIFSFAEILQDTFFIKLLLDIKRTVKNKEAKLYLVEFIKDISSVCLYEMSLFLDEAGILKKKDFYRSNGLKTVREHREWIKRKVIGSTTIQQKIKDMGINFSSKTYDLKYLNLVLKSFCDVMYIKVDEKDIRATKWAYKLMKSASRA